MWSGNMKLDDDNSEPVCQPITKIKTPNSNSTRLVREVDHWMKNNQNDGSETDDYVPAQKTPRTESSMEKVPFFSFGKLVCLVPMKSLAHFFFFLQILTTIFKARRRLSLNVSGSASSPVPSLVGTAPSVEFHESPSTGRAPIKKGLSEDLSYLFASHYLFQHLMLAVLA